MGVKSWALLPVPRLLEHHQCLKSSRTGSGDTFADEKVGECDRFFSFFFFFSGRANGIESLKERNGQIHAFVVHDCSGGRRCSRGKCTYQLEQRGLPRESRASENGTNRGDRQKRESVEGARSCEKCRRPATTTTSKRESETFASFFLSFFLSL